MLEYKKQFNLFLDKELNPEQKKAVITKQPISLVIAGAGSGKTRVITSRIINLILNENVPAHSIIALTFTNKAGREMRERVAQFIGEIKLPFIGTFHSYCLLLLKTNPALLQFKNFTIIDKEDQQKIINKILKENQLEKKISTKVVLQKISKIKNNYEPIEAIENQIIRDIFLAYEKEKKQSKCFDFDDLLLEVLKLFKTNKSFKEYFQSTVRHILVDEYQDTNIIQHELLKELSKNNNKFTIDSLCVVGDEDQSIYSWRGATISNIINFKNDFPKTLKIKIERNYRSVKQILDIANQVIKHNENRNPKKLWTDKIGTDRAKVLYCSSGYQEADVIANMLKNSDNLKDFAILYRTHFQSRTIEEALIKNSIAYKIIGGIQFYERKEIKDLLAYFRLIVNPFDKMAFLRIINCPTRGLGKKFEEDFINLWNKNIFEDYKSISNTILNSLKNTKEKSLKDFLKIFEGLDNSIQPSKALERILIKTGYISYLNSFYDPIEAETKRENVKEFVRAINHFEKENKNTISELLEEIALMQEKIVQNEKTDNYVQLMTLHAVKGLEFNTVIISGLEEGLLPSTRSILDGDAIEEERRLFYVGITRAKENIILTNARYRNTFGQTETQLPSRFLDEIPKSLIKEKDLSFHNSYEVNSFFSKAPKSKLETFVKPTSKWKKNHPVSHKKFGIGVIQTVEEKGAGQFFITAKFKEGIKKIDSKFLNLI